MNALLDVSNVTGGNWILGQEQALGEAGEAKGAITVNDRIAPGSGGPGVLRASDVILGGGAPWLFESGTAVSDRMQCGGSFLRGSGTNFIFDMQNTGVAGVYTLVTWAVATDFPADVFSAENVPVGLIPSFSIADGSLNLRLAEAGNSQPPMIRGMTATGEGLPVFQWTGSPGQSFVVEAATVLGPLPEAD